MKRKCIQIAAVTSRRPSSINLSTVSPSGGNNDRYPAVRECHRIEDRLVLILIFSAGLDDIYFSQEGRMFVYRQEIKSAYSPCPERTRNNCRVATFLLASGTFSALIRLRPKVTFNDVPIEWSAAGALQCGHPRQINANGWVRGDLTSRSKIFRERTRSGEPCTGNACNGF